MVDNSEGSEMTGNQLVAHNLKRARESRGLTQEQAADLLEPWLDERWSPASFSAAERSALPEKRSREFTADDVAAFAAAFELPLVYFLTPPADVDVAVDRIEIGRQHLTLGQWVTLLLPPESGAARTLNQVRATVADLNAQLAGYPGAFDQALAGRPRRKQPKEEK